MLWSEDCITKASEVTFISDHLIKFYFKVDSATINDVDGGDNCHLMATPGLKIWPSSFTHLTLLE